MDLKFVTAAPCRFYFAHIVVQMSFSKRNRMYNEELLLLPICINWLSAQAGASLCQGCWQGKLYWASNKLVSGWEWSLCDGMGQERGCRVLDSSARTRESTL